MRRTVGVNMRRGGAMPNDIDTAERQLSWLQLQTIIPLDGDKPITVEKITSLSRDSVCRNHRDKVVDLGPRRVGMRLGDALAIARSRAGAV
jgi:hypothetical protein